MRAHLFRTAVLAVMLLSAGMFTGYGQEKKGKFKGKAKTGPSAAPTEELRLPADWTKAMTWRCIGPANMGGRITAVSVYQADPTIYYVATASGGLLKTTNNGITFQHQFDKEATVSIGDVCVAPTNPDIVWVGTGENNPRNSVSYGDGVYKSTDGGAHWQNMGLKQTFQIGKILIHPKNPDIVYIGALGRLYGPNPERGLYKTMDGGKTWDRIFYLDENTGIIDMRMHPTEPETLIVAAWDRQRNGFDSMLGGTAPSGYDAYDPIKKWGPKAGIYKTTDGGKTFKQMTKGLPTNPLGRVGLDWYVKDPNVVFAVVDCEKIGMGTAPDKKIAAGRPYLGLQGEDAKPGVRLTLIAPDGPAAKVGLQEGDILIAIDKTELKTNEDFFEALAEYSVGDKVKLTVRGDPKPRVVEVTIGDRPTQFGGGGMQFGPGGAKKDRPYHAFYGGQAPNIQNKQGPNGHEYGGVYKSSDGGESWTRVNSLNPRPMYFSQVRVDPSDDTKVYVLGVSQYKSTDGGKTFRANAGRGVHADGHALWIDPHNGRHMLIGCDGGLYVSYDRTENWDHLNHMAMGQFYHVAVCNKKPYWVYGGLQDNGTWGGPSIGVKGGIGPINEDWLSVGGGDGFMCRVDRDDPDLVYGAIQDGRLYRRNMRTGTQGFISPDGPGQGKKGGKGAKTPEKAEGEKGEAQKAEAEKGETEKGKAKSPYRFNWNTPFILSNANPKIYYCAGNYVFKSLNQGEDLRKISGEITRAPGGSGTALSESPRNPDVLWAGTDDGNLLITRDGGKTWTNVADKVGLPGPRWVATIEASRFAEGRCYVCFDAHRSDDDNPYIYVTDDFGQTWKPLMNGLQMGSTRCLREDVSNENLLYLGTEFSVYASLDRGLSWTRINNNLPTVAVHEIAVHPSAGEIVAATHGRSLWIVDVSALRQMKSDAVKAVAHLYKPNTATRYRPGPSTGRTNRRFTGTNPTPGAHIYYSLANPADKVSLKIIDISGKTLRELKGPSSAGLHEVTWDMFQAPEGGFGGGFFGKKGFAGKEPAGKEPAGKEQAAKEKASKEAAGKEGEAAKEQPQKKGGKKGGFGGGPGGFARANAPPGDYRVVLTVDGREFSQVLHVEVIPAIEPGRPAEDDQMESVGFD